MNKMYVLPKDESGAELYRRIYLLITKNRWAWTTVGAACGLAGGMFSIILAALLWALVPLLWQDSLSSFLNLMETVFFVLPLPLLALGAHCLDLLDETPPLLTLLAESQSAVCERRYQFRPQRPHRN